jgi:hypothetical protein
VGSNPAEDDEFLRVIKIRSTKYFGGEVKSSVLCRLCGLVSSGSGQNPVANSCETLGFINKVDENS